MSNLKKTLTLLVFAVAVIAASFPRPSLAIVHSFENDFPGAVPPQISIQSPNEQTIYINGVPLNFTLKSGDMSFYRYDIAEGAYIYSLDNQPNATTNGNITVTGLAEGPHKIDAYYSYYVIWGQMAGPYYVSAKPVTFTVAISVPIITILSPENKTYNETTLDLIFKTHEEPIELSQEQIGRIYYANQTPPWIAYSLDGQAKITITDNATLPNLPNGSHSLVMYANNTEGNVSTSKTIDFAISATEPFPVTLVSVMFIVVVATITV
jgi:hypothetical protein